MYNSKERKSVIIKSSYEWKKIYIYIVTIVNIKMYLKMAEGKKLFEIHYCTYLNWVGIAGFGTSTIDSVH